MLSPAIDQVAVDGALSPPAMAAMLKIGLGDLAALTRVHRNTLLRNPNSPLVQARLGDVATILAKAQEMLGDQTPTRAVVWFMHQEMTGWGGHTAASLVELGRAKDVMWELESLDASIPA